MRQSESIQNVARALVLAQARMKNPKRNAEADAVKYTYTYATLDQILEDARPILADCKLSLLGYVEDKSVVTRVQHETGEWLENAIPMPEPDGRLSAIQELGSEITYLRRYGTQMMLGIAAEEDDDASAEGKTTGQRQTSTPAEKKACPKCGKAMMPGKPEFGGGWICWKKRAGCGYSEKSQSETTEKEIDDIRADVEQEKARTAVALGSIITAECDGDATRAKGLLEEACEITTLKGLKGKALEDAWRKWDLYCEAQEMRNRADDDDPFGPELDK